MSENDAADLRKKYDLATLREAFCTLVDHEDQQVVCGQQVASGEKALLMICQALAEDAGVMPRGTIRAINSYLENDRQLAFGSTYGQGAQAMRDEMEQWITSYAQARSRYLQGS